MVARESRNSSGLNTVAVRKGLSCERGTKSGRFSASSEEEFRLDVMKQRECDPVLFIASLVMTSTPTSSSNPPRHALTAVEKQRAQLDRLLKDPTKPAYVPLPPKEKSVRPAREMMKNVQGSSAGAGSGEFHVYKSGRRREYERLKIMDEQAQEVGGLIRPLLQMQMLLIYIQESLTAEFERKRREAQEAAEAKTAKNREKRQKKKERAKQGQGKSEEVSRTDGISGTSTTGVPLKKRRLVDGKELVFKKPGEGSGDEQDGDLQFYEASEEQASHNVLSIPQTPTLLPVTEQVKITIHEDD